MYKIGKFYKVEGSDQYIFIIDLKIEKELWREVYYAKKIILWTDKLDDFRWTMATKDYDWLTTSEDTFLKLVEPPVEVKEWVKNYLTNQVSIHIEALNALHKET